MINHLHVCIVLQSQIVRFSLKASNYQIVQIYQSVETRKHLISAKLRYKKHIDLILRGTKKAKIKKSSNIAINF